MGSKLWKKGQVRSFFKTKDGDIGVIIANDQSGGVYRGHADVWFGDFDDGRPRVVQIPMDGAEEIEAPLGILPGEEIST